jgi:hypothetical protein
VFGLREPRLWMKAGKVARPFKALPSDVNRQAWRGFRGAIVLPHPIDIAPRNVDGSVDLSKMNIQFATTLSSATRDFETGWLRYGDGRRVVQGSFRKYQSVFGDTRPVRTASGARCWKGRDHEISILRIFSAVASPFSDNFQA